MKFILSLCMLISSAALAKQTKISLTSTKPIVLQELTVHFDRALCEQPSSVSQKNKYGFVILKCELLLTKLNLPKELSEYEVKWKAHLGQTYNSFVTPSNLQVGAVVGDDVSGTAILSIQIASKQLSAQELEQTLNRDGITIALDYTGPELNL